MDYLDLALTYGGFTSLDKVYLTQKLAHLSDEDKLAFITPPPSVINAYFAEIYQKQSPQAATDYYFDLSCQLHLLMKEPSFKEEKPFVRLNLGGKSYGFAYESSNKVAQVFSEKEEVVTEALLFELAQIFPRYMIYIKENRIYMTPLVMEGLSFTPVVQSRYLLTDVAESQEYLRFTGYNQEEVSQVAAEYAGQAYYVWSGRTAMIYRKK
ncbi:MULTISPECIES: cystathionine beta-lyase [unclassified Streptococcus]|uniref:cystathionine beta-lyase n=1 Tax=unclassified Streptococcus TaxID=2608887 RepID=UPI0015696080|nr:MULTISPECIES: cystathionine beta-lyase [unclassified Streptococcus]